MNTNYSEALDQTHLDCMVAARELRTLFMRIKRTIVRYEMPPCPPRPPRGNKPLAVWLDETTPVPLTRPHVTGQPW